MRRCPRCDFNVGPNIFRCKECGTWLTGPDPKPPETFGLLAEVPDDDFVYVGGSHPLAAHFGGGLDLPPESIGWVPGGVYLLGGEPGAGKSTLALELVSFASTAALRGQEAPTAYARTEEASGVVKHRAKRLGLDISRVLVSRERVQASHPLDSLPSVRFLVVDSLSTMSDLAQHEAPLWVLRFKEWCVKTQCVGMLIVHVNKDDDFAGFRAVEHHVDATFILRRLENHTRVLECKKNRFGPANLRAFLRMGPQGLRVVEEETGASPKGDHTL